LTRHLDPWHYAQLNTLERLLLAQRIQTEQPVARRLAADWLDIQPVNRQRDLFLFETALRGRALMAVAGGPQDRMAGRNANRDWYFDTSEGMDPALPLPAEFTPWAGIAGAPNAFYKRRTDDGAGLIESDSPSTWEEYPELWTDLNRPERPNAGELQRLFQQGLGYYDLGQFNEAEVEFSKMLGLDPNSTAAQKGLERTKRGRTEYRNAPRDETRLRMLNDVNTLWGSQPGGIRAHDTWDARSSLESLARSEFFLTTRSNGPEATIRSTPRVNRFTTPEKLVPDQSLVDPLAAGDFDSGVAVVPEAAYLAQFRGFQLDGTARLFRQQEKTKVWAEQNYYRLPIEAQTAGLVPMNRFWRDYALWDGKAAFISANVADAAGSFAEMVLALAVLDLPFPSDFKAGKMETKDNVLTLTPTGRTILFHQDILPAEPDEKGAKLLVSQNFYREGDRYVEQGGEKFDKFVSAEFLTGVVYGCQVVVTNPSSSRQRLDVLFQIPAGSLPVKATRRVQSLPVGIEPYRTATLDFHFYFPQPGKFSHFPVHVSRDTKTAAFAAPFMFKVVPKPTINDPASWDYVSQHGTDNEVISFLEQHNLHFLDPGKMLWRMKNADFFRRAVAHLKSRHAFHGGTWSYAVLHNASPYLTEFLMASGLPTKCGAAFDSLLLTVDPVEQQTYQHLEYSPLVNARAHPLGGQPVILNDKFRAQWERLMEVLAFRVKLGPGDYLAVAGYMALQDRIGEALAFFAKADRAGVAEKLQYEYLRAWLAMCQDDTATARRIAAAFAPRESSNLPHHWRAKFAALDAQLDELEGKPLPAPDMADRESSQDSLAEKEPSMSLNVENQAVVLKYRNLEEVTVSYYPIDLEFLFSSSPFVSRDAGRFGTIRPRKSERLMLPAGGDTQIVALPGEFQRANVLVEVDGGGVTKTAAVFANALDVQVSESFGQLTVRRAGDRKPLPKSYVKVFADVNGAPVFYKDGYTDLRGRFDYASLSTSDLDGAGRFSILVMSEEHGAVVKEVKPPAR
jgi:hypothetical protein